MFAFSDVVKKQDMPAVERFLVTKRREMHAVAACIFADEKLDLCTGPAGANIIFVLF